MFADDEILLYDLGNRPATFDIFTCLATSIACGVKHVRFVLGRWKPKNYTIEQAEERWRSIVEPAPALFGLEYSIGEPRGIEYSHFSNATRAAYAKFGRIGKIQRPAEDKGYVTITLRKSRSPERDSKESEWREFAKRLDCKAVILRDYDEQPLDMADRVSLYFGARMNLMVNNGPLTLCLYSDAPYLCMRTIGCERSGSSSPAQMVRLGVTPGFQYPWAAANQRLCYMDDTADNIYAEYASLMREERRAA